MADHAIEDWTGEVGDRWLDHIDGFEGMLTPVGQALIAAADFKQGENVADIGCGCGANSLDIAGKVGLDGHVTGIDIAEKLLVLARDRAAAAGLGNVTFEAGDGQVAEPSGQPYDRLFSRFGIMFFDDSETAFANMRGWLKPGGQMIFACWAPPQDNPWMGLVGSIVGAHVEMPPPDLEAPGPFRLADPDKTRTMLESAGWQDVKVQRWTGEQLLGGLDTDPASAAEFVLSALAMREVLEEAGGTELVDTVRGEIVEAAAPFYREGAIRMEASAWFVSARNPG